MKLKRILKLTLFGLLSLTLILLVVLALIFFFWLGPTVKAVTENVGSKALGTAVTMQSLAINPREGTFELKGFQIGNHAGFGETNTASLAELTIAIDMETLFSDTIVIQEILIDSPHFVYEQSKATDNITEYITNIFAFAKIDPKKPKPALQPKEPEEPKEPKRVIIERLRITDVRMILANTDDPNLDIRATLEEFSLSMSNGVIHLAHLALSNPARLTTPALFELDDVAIKIDPESIYSGTLVIEDVKVSNPYAFLEQNPETDTVAEFMKIAEGFASKTKPPKPTETEANAPEPETGPEPANGPSPVELRNLLVDDIQIKLLDTTQTNAPAGPRTMASIGSISIKLHEGLLRIGTITVPNPPAGFITTNLFRLPAIDISIDPESIFSDQVVINEVFIDSPEINIEQTASTGNAAELQKIIKGFIPPSPETTTPPKPEPPLDVVETTEAKLISEQPVILELLVVTNLTINMTLPFETNAPATGLLASMEFGQLLGPDKAPPDGDEPAGETLSLLAFDQLSIEPLKGLVQIANLQIGNLPDFANEDLMKIEHFRLDIDPDSMTSDTLLIEDILIDKPQVSYERKLAYDNIQALQAFIESAFKVRQASLSDGVTNQIATTTNAPLAETAQSTNTMDADEDGEIAAEASGQKVIIAHLLVQHGWVKAKISALPTAPIPLPDIELTDIGKEEGGASVGDAVSKIYATFYDTIIGSVSGVTGFAVDALKGVGGFALSTVDNVTGGGTGTSGGKATDLAKEPLEESQPEKKKKRKRRIFPR